MTEISLKAIKEAYSRFKAYVYYDNFNLALRAQLAKYEADEKLIDKLARLASELTEYLNTEQLSDRLKKMIDDSGYIVLPKSFSQSGESQKKNSILISNQNLEEYIVDKTTILFEGDIELHLISTLWILNEGLKLNSKIGSDSYGYHLPLNPDENKIGSEKLLFTKYFEKYQEWRDRGIKAAKSHLTLKISFILLILISNN